MKLPNGSKSRRYVLALMTPMLALACHSAQATVIFDRSWDFFCLGPSPSYDHDTPCRVNFEFPHKSHPDNELRFLFEYKGPPGGEANVVIEGPNWQRAKIWPNDVQWCRMDDAEAASITVYFTPGQEKFRFVVTEYPKAGSTAPPCRSAR